MKQYFIKYEHTKTIHGEDSFTAADSVRIKAHTAKEAAEQFKKEHKDLVNLEIVDVHEFHKRTNEFKREMKSITETISHDQIVEAEILKEAELAHIDADHLEELEPIHDEKLEDEIHAIVDEAEENMEIEFAEGEIEVDNEDPTVEEYKSVTEEMSVAPIMNEEGIEQDDNIVVEETPAFEEAPVQEEVVEETPVVEEQAQEEFAPLVEEVPAAEEVRTFNSLEEVMNELLNNSSLTYTIEARGNNDVLVISNNGQQIFEAAITEELKNKLN